MYGGNNGTPMFPIFLDENQFQYDSNASMTQLQLFGSIPAACNVDPANYIGNNNISSLNRANKRSRESEDVAMQHELQISLNNFYQDATDRSASIPNPNAVSTGLRLSYDDDEHNSSVTTASGGRPSLPVVPLGDILRTEIERQKEEFDHYIRIQEEQFAKGVKEMKQRHIASFLNAIDKGVNRKLHEKEVEIETMNRKNRELADRIKQAATEAQNWQYRARYNESMVHALQNNLKQALAAQGAAAAAAAEQGREGCGESEVDDAASSYGPNVGQQQQQAMSVGACRVCMRREVCMLLLPCRHMCMCKECDGLVDACPVCLADTVCAPGNIQLYLKDWRERADNRVGLVRIRAGFGPIRPDLEAKKKEIHHHQSSLVHCLPPRSKSHRRKRKEKKKKMLHLSSPTLCRPPPCSPLLFFRRSLTPSMIFTSSNDSSITPTRTRGVRCMASQRRVKMVAKQIMRELSDMLLTDKVLQYAVLPEASLGADRYLSSLTTISDVEVSGDLQVVKVYVSVFGDIRGKEVAIAGLKSKAKYVRSELGRRMKLRLTPEIRFIEDESLEKGSRVIAILDRLKNEKKNSEGEDQSESPNLSEEDGEWDKDDTDEGIIYVK